MSEKGHPIHTVVGFDQVGTYSLDVRFADGTNQIIDFEPLLHGEVFGPLRDPAAFAAVRLDREIGTLVWPSGADFDPYTLHDWPRFAEELAERAKSWGRLAV